METQQTQPQTEAIAAHEPQNTGILAQVAAETQAFELVQRQAMMLSKNPSPQGLCRQCSKLRDCPQCGKAHKARPFDGHAKPRHYPRAAKLERNGTDRHDQR